MCELFLSDYDIIIQAGQSNAVGYGVGEIDKEYEIDDRIIYLYDKREIEKTETGLFIKPEEDFPYVIDVAKEREICGYMRSDFSLSFAKEYIGKGLLGKGRKLLIVRTAVGGTGFKQGNWSEQGFLFLRLKDMVDYALSLNSKNKVVGLLWHQGENDAGEGFAPAKYYEKISFILNFVRNRYGAEIPFVAGDFVNEWKNKNLEICEPIVNEIRRVVNDNKKSGFVETCDLLSNNQKTGNGDDIHFCRQALYELGERYFKVYYDRAYKNDA